MLWSFLVARLQLNELRMFLPVKRITLPSWLVAAANIPVYLTGLDVHARLRDDQKETLDPSLPERIPKIDAH